MVVVTNRIPVSKGHEIDFEDRFRRRVHLVDRAPGFVRNEVHRPRAIKFDHERGTWADDPEAQGYYEIKTWWRTLEDFIAWTKSPAFAEAHSSRPPKEMFAGPNVLEVHEILTSTDLDLGSSRAAPVRSFEEKRMSARVVCISRTLAAGGETVGRRVSADLGFRYVDEEIIRLASEKAQVDPELIAKAEHRQPLLTRLIDALAASSPLAASSYFTPPLEGGLYYSPGTAVSLPQMREDHKALIREAIVEVAVQGNAVIVAHAASFALGGIRGVLRVLITASEQTRIERMSREGMVNRSEAESTVKQSDRERRDYLRDFYDVSEERPTHYDLVINTDVLEADRAAAIVIDAARS